MIGKLEELTLLAVIRAGPNALANEVFGHVVKGQKKAAFGAVYTTLTRLSKKGFVEETAVTDEQARPRRGFTVTGTGRAAVNEALNASAIVGGWVAGGEHGLAV